MLGTAQKETEASLNVLFLADLGLLENKTYDHLGLIISTL